MTREDAYAERDERLRHVRAQAEAWRARAKAGQATAQAAIAARRVAARAAQVRAARRQHAAVTAFAVRVAEQRENAARAVERFNRKRGRA